MRCPAARYVCTHCATRTHGQSCARYVGALTQHHRVYVAWDAEQGTCRTTEAAADADADRAEAASAADAKMASMVAAWERERTELASRIEELQGAGREAISVLEHQLELAAREQQALRSHVQQLETQLALKEQGDASVSATDIELTTLREQLAHLTTKHEAAEEELAESRDALQRARHDQTRIVLYKRIGMAQATSECPQQRLGCRVGQHDGGTGRRGFIARRHGQREQAPDKRHAPKPCTVRARLECERAVRTLKVRCNELGAGAEDAQRQLLLPQVVDGRQLAHEVRQHLVVHAALGRRRARAVVELGVPPTVLVAQPKAGVRADAQQKVVHEVGHRRGRADRVMLAGIQAQKRRGGLLGKQLDLGAARHMGILEHFFVQHKQHVLHDFGGIRHEPTQHERHALRAQLEHRDLERRVERLGEHRVKEQHVLCANICIVQRHDRACARTPAHRQEPHVHVGGPVEALPHRERMLAARKVGHRREQLESQQRRDRIISRIALVATRLHRSCDVRVHARGPRCVGREQPFEDALAKRVVGLVRGEQVEQLCKHLHRQGA